VSRGVKRQLGDGVEGASGAVSATPPAVVVLSSAPSAAPPSLRVDDQRPHIKYAAVGAADVKEAAEEVPPPPPPPTTTTVATTTAVTQPPPLPVPVVVTSAPVYAVRQPIAFSTASAAAAAANGLLAHAGGVQLFGSSLKVLTPTSMAGVRVFTTAAAAAAAAAAASSDSASGNTKNFKIPFPWKTL